VHGGGDPPCAGGFAHGGGCDHRDRRAEQRAEVEPGRVRRQHRDHPDGGDQRGAQ